jgi:hypothetical protein
MNSETIRAGASGASIPRMRLVRRAFPAVPKPQNSVDPAKTVVTSSYRYGEFTLDEFLPGRRGARTVNAYLIRCAIAARTVQGPAGQLSGRRSMAPKGLIEGPETESAQTSSRLKSLVGLAVGAALLVTVSAIWRDRDPALAAKTFKETALVPQQVVAPSASTDVILAAIPQTEDTGVIVGVRNLHETDVPPRDLATTELQVGKAAAAQELPAAPAGDSQIAVPKMLVRADDKAPLAPTVKILKEARATAMDTATGPPLAEPSPPESVASLLRQGKRLLENGNPEAARDLFKDLAEAGVVDAAIALGSTYDPKSLVASGMTNVTPDLNKALLWYRRAHLLAESIARRERRPDRE